MNGQFLGCPFPSSLNNLYFICLSWLHFSHFCGIFFRLLARYIQISTLVVVIELV